MKRSLCLFVTLVWCASNAVGQRPSSRPAPAKPVAASNTARPKFKAIWERVNYKEDLKLNDVFFVNENEGWVSGAAGTILHTKDGGDTWNAQIGGDPHAQGADLGHLFFFGLAHGWAQAWNTMFRTVDGETWEQVSGDVRGDAFFVSDAKGFRAYGGKIYQTDDGGNSWKQVFACQAKMEVQGLTQEKNCDLWTLDFPTASVGYAMGDPRITAKTEDGGESWNILVGPEEPGDQRVFDVRFVDEKAGFRVVSSPGLSQTTDGGQTWKGVIAQLPNHMHTKVKFADREVGWSCFQATLVYTGDGGKHWTSRPLHFPAEVRAFSLPKRDRGYVVGDHGMIYRYRVVPFDYTSKGMIDAPMMPVSSAQ